MEFADCWSGFFLLVFEHPEFADHIVEDHHHDQHDDAVHHIAHADQLEQIGHALLEQGEAQHPAQRKLSQLPQHGSAGAALHLKHHLPVDPEGEQHTAITQLTALAIITCRAVAALMQSITHCEQLPAVLFGSGGQQELHSVGDHHAENGGQPPGDDVPQQFVLLGDVFPDNL